MSYPKRRDDDDRDKKRYPANPELRERLMELDEEGKEYYPAGDSGCYVTSNSTIYPDGTVVKDM